MANLSWPTLDPGTSTKTFTTNPDFIDPMDFSNAYIDPNSAVTHTNTIALRPAVSDTAWSSRVATTTNPEGWASKQDWDKYRAIITELFPELMLKELMEVMATEHNFKATEKMYKSRFTQWGLRKNAKRKGQSNQQSGREERPIDRSRCPPADDRGSLIPTASSGNLRTMESTATLPRPEERPIDRSRCPPADDRGSLIPTASSGNLRTMESTATLPRPEERPIDRSRCPPADDRGSLIPTASSGNLRTMESTATLPRPEEHPIDRSRCPPADDRGPLIPTVSSGNLRTMESTATLPRPLTTPPMLAIPERILVAISDYFRGSFEAGTWVSNGDGSRRCRSTKPVESGTAHLDLPYYQSLLACRLFDRGSFQDAGKALISATAQTKNVLLAEKPMTLLHLFRFILATHRRRRDEIAFAILRHFSAMAMAVLGDRHPICRISGWLSSMDSSRLDDVVDRCRRSVGDHFAILLGPMHLTALVARMDSMGGETAGTLRDLLGKCEHGLGLLDLRTLKVVLELSWRCQRNDNHNEAKILGHELFVRSQKLQSPVYKRHYHAESLYTIAISQYALGEIHIGEVNLLDGIAMKSERNPSRAALWLAILEKWLLKQGRVDSAAETRERRRKLQEALVSDEQ